MACFVSSLSDLHGTSRHFSILRFLNTHISFRHTSCSLLKGLLLLELGRTHAPPCIIQDCVHDYHHGHDQRKHLSATLLVLLQHIPVTEIIKDKSELYRNAQRNKANTTYRSEPFLDKQNTFLAARASAFDFLTFNFAFAQNTGVQNAENHQFMKAW